MPQGMGLPRGLKMKDRQEKSLGNGSRVLFNNSEEIVIGGGTQYIALEASQVLALLPWIIEHKETLEKLAKEEEERKKWREEQNA